MKAMNQPETLWFPPGEAPFGELNIIFPKKGIGQFNSEEFASLVSKGRSITHDSWITSSWIEQTNIGNPAISEVNDYYLGVAKSAKQAIQSGYTDNDANVAMAIAPPIQSRYDKETIEKGLGESIWHTQLLGWSNALLDVSGNFAQRFVKRYGYPEKVYGSVPNVDVRTELQGHKIGAALFYAGLITLPPEKHATTYVPSLNKPLIAKLGEFGFRFTGERERDDLLFPRVSIMESRLEAETVADATAAFIAKYPWLLAAQSRLDTNG